MQTLWKCVAGTTATDTVPFARTEAQRSPGAIAPPLAAAHQEFTTC